MPRRTGERAAEQGWPLALAWAGASALLAGAALATARDRSGTSGALIAAGALVKTWPAAIGLWLLRRGAHRPLRAVIVALGVGAIGLAGSFLLLMPTSHIV